MGDGRWDSDDVVGRLSLVEAIFDGIEGRIGVVCAVEMEGLDM